MDFPLLFHRHWALHIWWHPRWVFLLQQGAPPAHELQQIAEIYYFKPVNNILILFIDLKLRELAANHLSLHYVPRNY